MIKMCAKHDYTFTEGNCPGCEYDSLKQVRSIFDPWQPSVEQVEQPDQIEASYSVSLDDEIIELNDENVELNPDSFSIIRSQKELEKAFGLPRSSSFLDTVKFAIEHLKKPRP